MLSALKAGDGESLIEKLKTFTDDPLLLPAYWKTGMKPVTMKAHLAELMAVYSPGAAAQLLLSPDHGLPVHPHRVKGGTLEKAISIALNRFRCRGTLSLRNHNLAFKSWPTVPAV